MKPDNKDHLVLNEVKNIDHAIRLTGGIGRFQYMAFLSIVSGMVAGAFFLYSLPYFEKQPDLQCLSVDGTWTACTQAVACSGS